MRFCAMPSIRSDFEYANFGVRRLADHAIYPSVFSISSTINVASVAQQLVISVNSQRSSFHRRMVRTFVDVFKNAIFKI